MSDIIYCSGPLVCTNEDFLGGGTYGYVYVDKNNNAVKIYNTKVHRNDYGFNSSMIRELSSMCLLQSEHNFVPRIFAVYLENTSIRRHGFSMKKYDRTVDNLIMRKIFDVKQLKNVIYSITLCLAHAQKNLLLHRDIKPSNILINDNYDVTVTDWGLSLVKYSGSVIKNTATVQSLWYRAPEHLLLNIDEMNNDTMDMWSVGIMMIEMITNYIGIIGGDSEASTLLKLIECLGFPTDKKMVQLLDKHYNINKKSYYNININYIRDTCDLFCISDDCDDCIDFITKLLQWSPSDRLDPISALKHPYLFSLYKDDQIKYPDIYNFHSRYSTVLSQFDDSFSYKMNISKIKSLNANYLLMRGTYVSAYTSIQRNENMTINELILMILYTDKLMSSCAFTLNLKQRKIFMIFIANIISILFCDEHISLQNLNDNIMIFNEIIKHEEISQYANTILPILSFPLMTITFASYSVALTRYHESITKLYEDICFDIIKKCDYMEYEHKEIFGSILNYMRIFSYKDDKLFISFDNVLEELYYAYPKKFDIHCPNIPRKIKFANGYIFSKCHI